QKRDERGAVGIVLQPFDRRLDAPLGALEVDDPVALLVAAAAAAGRQAAGIVAPALLAQAFGQRLLGLARVQLAAVHQDEAPAARRGRFILRQSHWSLPFFFSTPYRRPGLRCPW